MGCTPSIHVFQTGVVDCRDSLNESSNDISPNPHLPTGIFTQTSTMKHGSGRPASTSSSSEVGKRPTSTTAVTSVVDSRGRISISEAETQTGSALPKGPDYLCLGPMRIKQHTMSIMLVFRKEDAQSDAFWWAAEKGSYDCSIVKNEKEALECYLSKPQDVIIVDARHNHSDAESLCQYIRSIKASEHTIIMAVVKNTPSGKEEPSIVPLLNAGCNKRFLENHSTSVCLNELVTLEHGEVRSQIKHRATTSLFMALERSSDAVEITSEAYEVQYVNPTFERLFGYSAAELIGKNIREFPGSDKNKPDQQEAHSLLKKGKPWEGVFMSKRKSGDSISHHCHAMPVLGQNGKVRHFVSIKTPILDMYADRYNGDISPITAGIYNKRRESMTTVRMHSTTIEAPITKVINMLNAAQENSSITVAQSLEKVLEILQSTELYSPYYSQQVKDDQMTHDLVGGLMTTNVKQFNSVDSPENTTDHRPPLTSSPSMILTQASTEIQNLLKSEAQWDFDILGLERATRKRPLVHLGLKTFRRFGVIEFLRVTEKEMAGWLQMIEENYHSNNSYHNSTHAADVMQASAYFLCRDKIKNIFDQMDEVACLLAAVIHDLDHPGRTNSFLANSNSPLSLLYNDLAILESHHASLAFRLTAREPKLNIFRNLDRDTFRTLRQQVIDMVLATEMTKHFEHLNKFVSGITQPQLRDDEGSTCGKNSPDSASIGSRTKLATPENRTLIKRMLIKCADVSNPVRPLHLCCEWAYRIAEEYFQQTDEEKEKNLPVVMPVFDRKTCNVPKSQLSFIDFFINDMFDTWDNFCDVPELMKCLQENYIYWKEQEANTAEKKQ